MKYQISTDEVIINHAKNHPQIPVEIHVGSSIHAKGIITSVNIDNRTLVIQDECGKKYSTGFDYVTIPVYQ